MQRRKFIGKGYTLPELLATLVILSLLAAIVYPFVKNQSESQKAVKTPLSIDFTPVTYLPNDLTHDEKLVGNLDSPPSITGIEGKKFIIIPGYSSPLSDYLTQAAARAQTERADDPTLERNDETIDPFDDRVDGKK